MNEWISVKDRLPEENVCVLVVVKIGDRISVDTDRIYRGVWFSYGKFGYKQEGCVTHWMPFPAPPTEQDKLTFVDNNKMLWVGKEHFRCSCGGNVFSEYKDNDGKRVFECHSCKSKYEGE